MDPDPSPADADAEARDVAAVRRLGIADQVLEALARLTDRRIALIARVTEDAWTACAVRDGAGFGVAVGDRLDVRTTY